MRDESVRVHQLVAVIVNWANAIAADTVQSQHKLWSDWIFPFQTKQRPKSTCEGHATHPPPCWGVTLSPGRPPQQHNDSECVGGKIHEFFEMLKIYNHSYHLFHVHGWEFFHCEIITPCSPEEFISHTRTGKLPALLSWGQAMNVNFLNIPWRHSSQTQSSGLQEFSCSVNWGMMLTFGRRKHFFQAFLCHYFQRAYRHRILLLVLLLLCMYFIFLIFFPFFFLFCFFFSLLFNESYFTRSFFIHLISGSAASQAYPISRAQIDGKLNFLCSSLRAGICCVFLDLQWTGNF